MTSDHKTCVFKGPSSIQEGRVDDMSEKDAIERTRGPPLTVDSIADDLSALGVEPGMVLMVHSSLSSLGWVCGGAVAVILAIEKALGPEGTLVMPSTVGDNSDPASWRRPPVPEDWWPVIRENTPAFDPDMTPTRKLGVIPECFWKQPGTLRSSHPNASFAARGPKAQTIVGEHSLDFSHGEGSPLARVYDLDGWVMLMGVDHDVNTSLHLAEHRSSLKGLRRIRCGAPMTVAGRREWVGYDDIETMDDDFPEIGARFAEETGLVRNGPVGYASSRLIPQRQLVDFAVRWMDDNRTDDTG
jgi:aminoglycoside 3-N-acetyltransferase